MALMASAIGETWSIAMTEGVLIVFHVATAR